MLTKEDIQRLLFCIDLIIQNYGENAELEKIYDKLIKIRSDVK